MIVQHLISNFVATLDSIVLPLLTILDAIRTTSGTGIDCGTCAGSRASGRKGSGNRSPCWTSNPEEVSGRATGAGISWSCSDSARNTTGGLDVQKVPNVAW
jgi:hypothetical protein